MTISFVRGLIPHNGGRRKAVGGDSLADYRKMYDSLFNDVTDAISLLQRAQQKTEEIFMSGDDGVILDLPQKPGPGDKPE